MFSSAAIALRVAAQLEEHHRRTSVRNLRHSKGARNWVGTKSESGRNHVWNRVPATMNVLSYSLRWWKVSCSGLSLAKDAEHRMENINFSAQFHYS
jgi:hypothetical protein